MRSPTTPGNPSAPAMTEVKMFTGTTMSTAVPIALIITKTTPPKILLNNNFMIFPKGINSIFPKKYTPKIPIAYARNMPASIPKLIAFTRPLHKK